MNSLFRFLGGAVWISVLQTMIARNEAVIHSRLVETVRPDNPISALRWPTTDFSSPREMLAMNHEISHQALMVAYADVFWAMFVACLVMAPLIMMLRPSRRAADASADPLPHMVE